MCGLVSACDEPLRTIYVFVSKEKLCSITDVG